jgi:hypothetical protein
MTDNFAFPIARRSGARTAPARPAPQVTCYYCARPLDGLRRYVGAVFTTRDGRTVRYPLYACAAVCDGGRRG